ncbi:MULTISPECIES: hypothetical protein [Pontibacillus]|uniref:S9 family peptidase n=1 Tax=Pontibacillus chungwhensis TaxID=265426 RepID=A0ABY8UY54_9BACI|nr:MULTISPECIES: hypothetical protein [Pontibacillus]MCD5325795.1 hypothetical protein [Pontibacillus sp. HN14]WIF98328.1 hypothetical protein QNI29_01180 [Pontibacillus chungwhensis]
MRDEDLHKQMSEFPHNQTLSNQKKEQMKQAIRNELGNEKEPDKEPRRKKWTVGIAGIAALALFLITVLSLGDFSSQQGTDLTPEEEKAKEDIQKELESSRVEGYAWSPDGHTVVFRNNLEEPVLSMRTVERPSTTTALTSAAGMQSFEWSPDSQYVQVVYDNQESYAVRYYNKETKEQSPFFIPQATQIPVWKENGASIATAHIIQNEKQMSENAVMIHHFKEGETKRMLQSKDVSYHVTAYKEEELKLLEINTQNGHQSQVVFNRIDGTWEKSVEEENHEPYSKAYIEETLKQNQGDIKDYEWSPNGEKVLIMEVLENRLALKQWNVGEESPVILHDGADLLADQVAEIRWMADQKALVVLKRGEQLNSRLPFTWLSVDLGNQKTSKARQSVSMPVWGPDGDRVAVSEGVKGPYENSIMIYTLDGSKEPERIYSIPQNGGGLSELKVDSWPSPDQMNVLRTQGESEAPILLVNEENSWKRKLVQEEIPIRAFREISINQSLPNEEPYSMWEEVRRDDIGGEISATVHFYEQLKDDPNSPVMAYVKREGYWYRIGKIARIQDEFKAERVVLDGSYEGIAIHGYDYEGGGQESSTAVLQYHPNDRSLSFEARIPNFTRMDLDGDGTREILGFSEDDRLLYQFSDSITSYVSLNRAIGTSSITIQEVNGEEIIHAEAEDGQKVRYSYNGKELIPKN